VLLYSGVAGSEGRPRAHHLLSGELGQGRVDGLGGLEEDALNGSLVGQGTPAHKASGLTRAGETLGAAGGALSFGTAS
jgi:hypothetical protein